MTEHSMSCRPSETSGNLGLLVLRLGIGATFLLVHGGPKILAGPEKWTQLGGAMGLIGISFAPAFWGFMAAISEALGGLFLMLGIFVRPAAFFMLFTMFIAVLFHYTKGESFFYPLEMGLVFLALLIGGGGKYTLLGKCCSSKSVAPESTPAPTNGGLRDDNS